MNHAEFPGHALAERREQLGLSRLDVYRRIHVPIQYIASFEEGRLRDLPGRTYAVGFLTTYCRFLDLDSEPYIDQFHACTQAPPASRFFAAQLPEFGRRPMWMTEVAAWGTICVVLLLGWLTYSVIVRPQADSAQNRVEATTVEVAPPTHFEEDF
jgi:cytoskeleton protein RodZ